jgi:DNA-binding transcriptional LysR family regulator
MLSLEAFASFVAIVEAGSLAGAARRLGLSKSLVSARLSDLERSLGVKLIRRTTRALALTQEGGAFYGRAQRIIRDVETTANEIAARRGSLTGSLRISAPVGFGNLHLGPALFGFLARYPDIEMTLEVDDRFVDVVGDGYDAVVRHGPVDDKRLVVKRLAKSRRVLVASPGYIKRYGRPASLAELGAHRGVIYSNRGGADWRFRIGRKWKTVTPQAALRVNNGLLMCDAAAAGLGIALLPTFFLHAKRDSRSLKVIDVGAEAEGAEIFVAYPEDLRSAPKIEALTGWLRRAFGEPPYWDRAG